MGIQIRTGYQNQATSSLEQGQVSGGPAAYPHQNFCSVGLCFSVGVLVCFSFLANCSVMFILFFVSVMVSMKIEELFLIIFVMYWLFHYCLLLLSVELNVWGA